MKANIKAVSSVVFGSFIVLCLIYWCAPCPELDCGQKRSIAQAIGKKARSYLDEHGSLNGFRYNLPGSWKPLVINRDSSGDAVINIIDPDMYCPDCNPVEKVVCRIELANDDSKRVDVYTECWEPAIKKVKLN